MHTDYHNAIINQSTVITCHITMQSSIRVLLSQCFIIIIHQSTAIQIKSDCVIKKLYVAIIHQRTVIFIMRTASKKKNLRAYGLTSRLNLKILSFRSALAREPISEAQQNQPISQKKSKKNKSCRLMVHDLNQLNHQPKKNKSYRD